MKSFFKKLAFVMAMAMVVSMAAPAAQRAAAATAVRIFDQNLNTEVTSVVAMKVGQEEVVDLCFKDAPPEWRDYTWGWATSDPTVAVVDKKGVVIPVGAGTATITLVTDCDVTATPVTVTVTGAAKDVAIGTSKTDTFTEKEIMLGDEEVTDLNFYGVTDWNGGKTYKVQWVSSDRKVATVDELGRITPVAPGKTNVTFVGTNTVTHESYVGTVEITVVDPNAAVYVPELDARQIDMETIYLASEAFVDEDVTADDFRFMLLSGEGTDTAEPAYIDAVDVEKDGEMTARATFAEGVLKAGTTLYIIYNTYGASAKVVIAEPEEEPIDASYTVIQRSDTVVELKFADARAASNNIALFYLYDADIKADCQIEDITVKDNVVTIKPYVGFQDGQKYIVKVNDEAEGIEFTTRIGMPDRIEIAYKSLKTDSVAYTNGEDGERIPVELDAKLYSGLVDVTNVYGKDNIIFTLEQDNDYCEINDLDRTLEFSKAGITVKVIATYTYYDNDGKEVPVPGSKLITSVSAPVYKINGVKAWTIVQEGKEKDINWNKTVEKIDADDDLNARYYIVALLEDNYGNVIAVGGDGKFNNGVGYKDAIPYDGSQMQAEGFYVEFSSANDEKLLVDTDGTLTTYTKTVVSAILGLYKDDLEKGDIFVRNLRALPITVNAKKELYKVSPDATSVTVLTDAIDAGFREKSVKINAQDQYGNGFGIGTGDVTVECTTKNATVTQGDLKITDKDGVVTITLDGKVLKQKSSGAKSLTFTVTAEAEGIEKTTSFRVALQDPTTIEVEGETQIRVTKYQVAASDVNCYIEEKNKGDNNTNTRSAVIEFLGMNGNYPVAKADVDVIATTKDMLTIATDDAKEGIFLADGTKVEVGNQVLVIYKPDGKTPVGNVVQLESGKYTFSVATPDSENGKMQYADTGKYTVKVLTVVQNSRTKKHELQSQTALTKTFNVTNTSATVTFAKQKYLDVTLDNREGFDGAEPTTAAEAVVAALQFNLGGSEWKDLTSNMVEKVVGRYNGRNIIVTSVTFKVPLNGKSEDSPYYEVTVRNIGKSIRVSDSFDGESIKTK